MATTVGPTCRGVVLMSAPSMKLIGPTDTELRHILHIHYVLLWPWPLTYFTKNWVTWPRVIVECTRLFRNL